MGSQHKQTKQRQKQTLSRMLAARKALLAGQGLEGSGILKDDIVRHLQAEISRAERSLAAIASRERIVAEAQQQKQQKAALKKDAAAHGKEKPAAAPPEKPKKKKKEKPADTQ